MAKDKPPKPPKPPKAARSGEVGFGALRRVLDQLTGARLCYGEPVVAGGRTVIPVARVQAAGGQGWGTGSSGVPGEGDGSGGGGGGWMTAVPAGYIEVDAEGSRFVEIRDPERLGRTLKAGAAAATALITGVAGARRLGAAGKGGRLVGRSRRTRRLGLPRGR